MPDDWLYRWVQINWWPLENWIWAVQYSFKMQLAGSCPKKALGRPPLIVRHHIWDLGSNPRNGVWRPSGAIFGTVRHQFWDRWAPVIGRPAPVLGSSGTSFGISRSFLGYKKEPKRCNKGCFRVFKGVLELPYVNICYSDHVNHPYEKWLHLGSLGAPCITDPIVRPEFCESRVPGVCRDWGESHGGLTLLAAGTGADSSEMQIELSLHMAIRSIRLQLVCSIYLIV